MGEYAFQPEVELKRKFPENGKKGKTSLGSECISRIQ